jgi:large subunit ribosomal protein L9
MLIILKETTRKLGSIGDVIKVKRGFARNFLIPYKKAVRATKLNLEILEKEKEKIKQQQKKELELANTLAKSIKEIDVLPIFAQLKDGKLFGSVNVRSIISALEERKIKILQKNVVLKTAIRESGQHDINIFLHPEVNCNLKIHILDISKKQSLDDDKKI